MNPLDTGEGFEIEFMNPNPTSSKTKSGPMYRISFEVHREAWDCFMDAPTNGMVLEGQLRVTEAPVQNLNQQTDKWQSGEPYKGDPQEWAHEIAQKKKGGPISKAAAMLCQDDKANEFARNQGYDSFKHMIYAVCFVKSRAELDHVKDAALQYQRLKRAFIKWADL